MQEGYRTQQATKPQSLSYSMIDSPVGTAAWILEKFHGWSDLNKGKIEKTFSNDELISNIMIYIITNSFNTAAWIYFGKILIHLINMVNFVIRAKVIDQLFFLRAINKRVLFKTKLLK